MYKLGRHEIGKGFRIVGHIEIDLDTPTPVLREFIRRFCGAWLNKHANVRQQCFITLRVVDLSLSLHNFARKLEKKNTVTSRERSLMSSDESLQRLLTGRVWSIVGLVGGGWFSDKEAIKKTSIHQPHSAPYTSCQCRNRDSPLNVTLAFKVKGLKS